MAWLGAALLRRRAALAMVAVVFVTGLVYTFWWNTWVHHSSSWATGNDVWGIFLGAHYVGWGYLGGIYNQTGMVTFPGIAVILAPAALLSDWFHLSASIGQFDLPHPTSLLLIAPMELLLSGSMIVAADALAEELDAPPARRYWLVVAVGIVAWPLATVWGHAEDALVMTFGMYAMVAMLRGNWRRMGWLMGCAIVVQPLIALTLPLFVAASPAGARLRLAVRSLALSAFLVMVALIGNPDGTVSALVRQPALPALNHPTPWLAFAPRISSVTVSGLGTAPTGGAASHGVHGPVVLHGTVVMVSGGTGRSVYVLLAVLLGLYVWRRPQDPVRLLWLAGVVLAARCWFEAVMTPYYVAPSIVLLLVLACRTDARRFAGSISVALGVSWFAYWRFAPWVWWPPIVVGLMVLVGLAHPDPAALRSGSSDVDVASPLKPPDEARPVDPTRQVDAPVLLDT